MKVQMVGTILPTNETLAADAAYARRVSADKARVGNAELRNCDRRTVGGEVRYYQAANRYAVVNSRMQVRWFELRDNGEWFAAK